MAASITISNLPEIIRILYDLRTALSKGGELGKVFSTGANQGRGNYEHWVQSAERQTSFHKRTGWHTDQTAVEYFSGKLQGLLDKIFGDIADGNIISLMQKFTDELLAEVLEYMQDYPPVPPGSTYVRTYTLHDSWTAENNL